MYISQLMSAPRLHTSLLLLGATLALGCETTPNTRDASAPVSQRVAEVSVRVDAPHGGAPAISLLAFRASVTGAFQATDLLGVIDPLSSAAPEHCELKDVSKDARSLRAQGGTVDLEELPNVSLALGAGTILRPAPRVYPQLASSVGGVFGEAGPLDLAGLPESIEVALPGEEARTALPLLGVPRIVDQSGEALSGATRLDTTGDLQLTITGPPRSFLEIRPFGASRFIACPAGPGGRVAVPRELIEKLTASGGHVAVSFEAVWRDSRLVTGAQTTRLSIEARSSAVLDLRAQALEPTKPTPPIGP
jgi:hypothetical protein